MITKILRATGTPLGLPRSGRVAVLHAPVGPDAGPDEQDLLEEIELVSNALISLGWEPVLVPCTLDLAGVGTALADLKPCFVFNLVETLDGDGRLAHLAPALLEHAGLPFTGSPASAILSTSSKLMAKQILRAARVPTASWLTLEEAREGRGVIPEPAIIKPVWEDASVGIDESSVVWKASHVVGELEHRTATLGTPCFAEAYIDGREFNVAIVAGPHGPRVLPPAEMTFQGFEDGRPKVMGYRAKWDEDADVYDKTCRTFQRGPDDVGLIRRLRRIVRRCWDLFGLKGWARVDLRVNAAGLPLVLEINANPCISPGAGFLAAAAQARLDPVAAVARIVSDLNVPPVRSAAVLAAATEETHEPHHQLP